MDGDGRRAGEPGAGRREGRPGKGRDARETGKAGWSGGAPVEMVRAAVRPEPPPQRS